MSTKATKAIPGFVTGQRTHRSARGALVGLAASMLLNLGVGPAAADDSTTMLWSGFESGAAPSWAHHRGVRVAHRFAHSGHYGARAVARPDRPAYFKWTAPKVVQDKRYARIGGWFRVDKKTAGESIGLFSLKNANGSNHFDVFRDPSSGRFEWDLYRNDSGSSTMRARVGKWYYIEALVDFGGEGGTTYIAQVRINGVDQPTITSEDQDGTTVHSAYFGDNETGKTNAREYDSLFLELADHPLTFSW